MARERLRIRENLLDYSHKYQDLANQKMPPKLFDTNQFYNDLFDNNLVNTNQYKGRQNALKNWKRRIYNEPKINKRPLDEHFQFTQQRTKYSNHDFLPATINISNNLPLIQHNPYPHRPYTEGTLQPPTLRMRQHAARNFAFS